MEKNPSIADIKSVIVLTWQNFDNEFLNNQINYEKVDFWMLLNSFS